MRSATGPAAWPRFCRRPRVMASSRTRFLRTTFGRLVITLLLVMVPLYTIAYFIYKEGETSIPEEIVRSNVAKVDFMIAHFKMSSDASGPCTWR
jgi:Na+/proline symporter